MTEQKNANKAECSTCFGQGMWAFGLPAPMGPMDARGGMPTVACPECGASANPATVKAATEAPKKQER